MLLQIESQLFKWHFTYLFYDTRIACLMYWFDGCHMIKEISGRLDTVKSFN